MGLLSPHKTSFQRKKVACLFNKTCRASNLKTHHPVTGKKARKPKTKNDQVTATSVCKDLSLGDATPFFAKWNLFSPISHAPRIESLGERQSGILFAMWFSFQGTPRRSSTARYFLTL